MVVFYLSARRHLTTLHNAFLKILFLSHPPIGLLRWLAGLVIAADSRGDARGVGGRRVGNDRSVVGGENGGKRTVEAARLTAVYLLLGNGGRPNHDLLRGRLGIYLGLWYWRRGKRRQTDGGKGVSLCQGAGPRRVTVHECLLVAGNGKLHAHQSRLLLHRHGNRHGNGHDVLLGRWRGDEVVRWGRLQGGRLWRHETVAVLLGNLHFVLIGWLLHADDVLCCCGDKKNIIYFQFHFNKLVKNFYV